jgi:DNA-binding transcriptional ArsR family regulator
VPCRTEPARPHIFSHAFLPCLLNLLRERPLPAGEIAAHFSMTGATVSHHLAVLKEAGLISDRHEGKYIYYELNLSVFEEVLSWVQQFLNQKEESEHEN